MHPLVRRSQARVRGSGRSASSNCSPSWARAEWASSTGRGNRRCGGKSHSKSWPEWERRPRRRFNREIQALGRVDHPHVVKVFTSGSDGDLWFYAMELVEGVPLSTICERLEGKANPAAVDLKTWHDTLSTACAESRQSETPLSDPQTAPRAAIPNLAHEAATHSAPSLDALGDYSRRIAELIAQVARGAHALHEAGVVHRDIKPGNIMVTANGTHAVLVDLGVAQLADDMDGKLTRTRQVVGTLRYASPQQVLAVEKLDRRTDIYSLGVTLWELLTLHPFLGATDDMPEPVLMEKIQHDEPARVRSFHPQIRRDLEAIVQKCLEKDPRRRYQTADELACDLERFLNGEGVQAHRWGRCAARSDRRNAGRHARHPSSPPFWPCPCCSSGYRYWDAHFRVKVEYYANFTKEFGAPAGHRPGERGGGPPSFRHLEIHQTRPAGRIV